mgnify:FL=1
MIIFLVFVMQSAAQLLFAQNLTIEVCDIEKVEGASLCRHLQFGRNIHEETLDRLPDRCERYVALHSLPGVTYGYVCHFVVSRRERKRETGYCRFRHSYREVRVQQ